MPSSPPLLAPSEIPSPALIFYPHIIRENAETVVALAGSASRLWPHIKTHKTREIVLLLMELGVKKFKCATIAEAELLGNCNVEEVILAYPLYGPNIQRFVRIIQNFPATRFLCLVEEIGCAEKLSQMAMNQGITNTGASIEVLVDVNPGMNRTGAIEDEVPGIYRSIETLPGLTGGGIHWYDGHNRQVDPLERLEAARYCVKRAGEIKRIIEESGGSVPRLIMGGTPIFPMYAQIGEVGLSPGTAFLFDAGYANRFVDLPFEPAAFILGRVISIPRVDRITIDVGSKAIAADPPGDRGVLLGHPGAKPISQSEEHWVFQVPGTNGFSRGDPVFILPTHICPSVALHSEAVVIDEKGNNVGTWSIAARDRRISI